MISLVLLLLLGFGMAYFATQNTQLVSLMLASFPIMDIPLYGVVIGSVLLGILASWIISLAQGASTIFTMWGKDTALSKAHQSIKTLERENREQELEIARLKGEIRGVDKAENHEEVVHTEERPSLLHRLKHNLGVYS